MSIFRKRTKTEKKYSALKITHGAILVGSYPLSAVPLAAYTGANWNNWLQQTNSFSLGWGFGTALLGIFVTILGLFTCDKFFSKKLSKLIPVGVGILIIGGGFVLLAELYRILGYMFLCVGGGLCGGGITFTLDELIVQPKLNRYSEVLKGTTLDKEHKKKDKIREQAIKDGIIQEGAVD